MDKDRYLFRNVPVWDDQPFVERLNIALKALKIHKILSDKEYERAFKRLCKQWEEQYIEEGNYDDHRRSD